MKISFEFIKTPERGDLITAKQEDAFVSRSKAEIVLQIRKKYVALDMVGETGNYCLLLTTLYW